MFDTIAAISSGNINQPISIIRVSGPEAFSIVKKIFDGKVGTDKTITYGYVNDKSEKIDEVLAAWFKGPKTFTGEDVVEINAHGGVVNTNHILRLLLANGARLAEPGEFSRRAFLNGKLDLVKAEAIHDLIFASTEEQAKLSVKKFDGQTSNLIENLKTKLLNIVATIEINIDYPEYDDVETLTKEELLPKLQDVKADIRAILEASKSSRYVYEGVKVAIVGRPNVGKSSLLNAILNEDKAIVTDIPGTTRDIVEGKVQVGQVLLNFSDTAGIRATSDVVEQKGIEKAMQQIKNADLVLHVIDATKGEDKDDKTIAELSKVKSYIKVFNKTDLIQANGVAVSAKNKDISQLIEAIKHEFKTIDLNDSRIVTNTRQLSLIERAASDVDEAIAALAKAAEPSIVIIDIRNAWENLANILGRAEQEDLLDMMFKNFCLGK